MNQIKRQVVMAIASVGISPADGGRVREVAAIELIDGLDTGKCWQASLNPEADPARFHWPEKDSALNLPTFKEVASDLIEFLSDSELVLAMAEHPLMFLNAELELMGWPKLSNPILDLLEFAKPLHPAASCLPGYFVKRYRISIPEQEYPGILREAKEVAEAYRAVQQRIQEKHHQGDEDHGHASGILDLAEAKRIAEDVPPSYDGGDLDLSAYHAATPEGLEYLSTQGYDAFVSLGLLELNLPTARILSQWEAFFSFCNVQALKPEVVAALPGEGGLIFERALLEFSPELARKFARMDGLIDLHLLSLSRESALELAQHPHEMYLHLDSPPGDDVLQALCFHAGYRLSVHWERPAGAAPWVLGSVNERKRIFSLPRCFEESGRWFENVYIGDADFYPDSLVINNGELIGENGAIYLP